MKRTLLSVLLIGCGATPTPCAIQPELPSLSTEIPENVANYDRSVWGRWTDADEDCQDTRQEVLISESIEPPTFDEKGCTVIAGRWVDPYTGETFTNPGLLDVDHMVPLAEAHDAGGSSWTSERKSQYFNDLEYSEHLVAVDRTANRSKGSRTPLEWMPPNEAHHCEYLRAWVTVKRRWGLAFEDPLKLLELIVEKCRPGGASQASESLWGPEIQRPTEWQPQPRRTPVPPSHARGLPASGIP